MSRSVPRAALVLVILAVIVACLWAGSRTSSCTATQNTHHHRTSVVRVERCAAAGFRSLVRR
ncbi:hypothetical protein [Nocardia macrotermitis]|uniref:Uncharacterized protein n=1 Tax=Nocardia macrotermitis TaxID=2585198 RepID=A0A7K0D4U3_9NOCA|nr:hypothetical protein [Nocardia macrotermitis]MQY20766.1 hypothetical protein [Nocardia macrotermitis]